MSNILLAGGGRLWIIENRAGPFNTPEYIERGMADAPDWGQGDVNEIEIPSDTQYNRWKTVETYRSKQDRVTLPMTIRGDNARSKALRLVRLRCAVDVQVHYGRCENPRDFNFGWDEKCFVFEDAEVISLSMTSLMAIQEDDQTGVDEEIEISADTMFEILRMVYVEVAAALVSELIRAIDVCDNIACGDCGSASDGCQKVFALSDPSTSSPGLLPQIIATEDAYATAVERFVTTFLIGEEASDGTCVGKYYVAVSSDGEDLHYAPTADILDEDETWTAIATGIVAGNGPNCIVSYSPLHTWIGGLNGYVYFSDDPTAGVTVQDAGVATAQDLNDIEAFNTQEVIACGDSNAFIYTLDGGSTWTAVTGPAVGVDLRSCGIRKEGEWWVGDDGGDVWITTDRGATWTEMTALKGTPTQIDKIKWANETVGYICNRIAGTAGKIQRTISGGKWWYIVPETEGTSIPANDYLLDLDVCAEEVNILFAGGLADNGSDGIIIKGSDV